MATLATTVDVADRWRPLSAQETALALVLLGDASALVRRQYPDIDARIAAGDIDPGLVAAVVATVVIRVMRNPDGKVQESIDDYTYRRADPVADGLLYLTDHDVRALAPASLMSGAFTISPYGEPGYATNRPLNWWELNL